MSKCNTNSRWINTEVNFTWDDELQQLIEVSSEGYCYDGPMALACPDGYQWNGTSCVPLGGGDDDDGGGSSPSHWNHYHQPHSVQQAQDQYANGYVVHNDLIIPSGFNYRRDRNGFISMMCRCLDQDILDNVTQCNVEQDTCVLWQVFDINYSSTYKYIPYKGTSITGTIDGYGNYNDPNIINIMCSSESPYNIKMDTDHEGNQWPGPDNGGAATPCLTMSSQTCISKDDLLNNTDLDAETYNNISSWHGGDPNADSTLYNIISDYWYDAMNNGGFTDDIDGSNKTCYDVFGGANFESGKYTMIYLDFRVGSSSSSNTWNKSQPFEMISQSPVIENIGGIELDALTGDNTITIEAFDPQGDNFDVFLNATAVHPNGNNNTFTHIGSYSGDESTIQNFSYEIYLSFPGTYIAEAYAEDVSGNQSKTKQYSYTIGGDILGTFGCMNSGACNYDEEAGFGEDSEYCIFPVQYYQDSDGDGTADNVGTVDNPVGVTCGEPVCQSLIADNLIEIPTSTFYFIDNGGDGDFTPANSDTGFLGDIIVSEGTTGAVEGTSVCIPLVAGVDFPYDECTGSYDSCSTCNGPGLVGDCSYFQCCNLSEGDSCQCEEADCSHIQDSGGVCCEKEVEFYSIACYCDSDGDLLYNSQTTIGPICFPECPDGCYEAGHEYWQGQFGPEIFGCTDDVACNYNPAATQDNDTCEYGQGFDDYIDTIIVDTTSDIYYELFNNSLSTNESILQIEYADSNYVIFQYINDDYQYVIPSADNDYVIIEYLENNAADSSMTTTSQITTQNIQGGLAEYALFTYDETKSYVVPSADNQAAIDTFLASELPADGGDNYYNDTTNNVKYAIFEYEVGWTYNNADNVEYDDETAAYPSIYVNVTNPPAVKVLTYPTEAEFFDNCSFFDVLNLSIYDLGESLSEFSNNDKIILYYDKYVGSQFENHKVQLVKTASGWQVQSYLIDGAVSGDFNPKTSIEIGMGVWIQKLQQQSIIKWTLPDSCSPEQELVEDGEE